jgi:hypothetical protein
LVGLKRKPLFSFSRKAKIHSLFAKFLKIFVFAKDFAKIFVFALFFAKIFVFATNFCSRDGFCENFSLHPVHRCSDLDTHSSGSLIRIRIQNGKFSRKLSRNRKFPETVRENENFRKLFSEKRQKIVREITKTKIFVSTLVIGNERINLAVLILKV